MTQLNKSTLAFILFAMTASTLLGQNPYHFILGQEKLAAVDVYDINQTADGRYWIATDNGIYGYDGYAFTKYQHNATLSNSFFNLIKDNNDVIHFNNLNGQIFRIVGRQMELVHAIPDSLLAPYTSFNFLKNNELVVRGLNSYRITKDGLKFLFEQKRELNSSAALTRDYEGNLLLQLTNNKLVKISENGVEEIRIYNVDSVEVRKSSNFTFIYHRTGIFANDAGHSLFKVTDSSKNHLQIEKILSSIDPISRMHLNTDKLWVANHRFGVRSYSYDFDNHQNEQPSKLLFRKHFISEVFEDANGNTLLGTFGDGIIVIPKTGVENMMIGNDIKLSKISSNKSGGLFLGGFNGNVYNYDSTRLDTLYNKGVKLIETLFFMEEQKLLFFDQHNPLLMNINTKKLKTVNVGSVKDITKIDESNYALATNTGALKVTVNSNEVIKELPLYSGRTYSLTYDSASRNYYIAGSKGLLIVDSLLEQQFVTYKNSPLMVNDIEYTKYGVIAGTKKYGLLYFTGSALIPFIDKSNGLLSNSIEQFKVLNNWIFVASDRGFQVFDNSGKFLKTLSVSDGLKSTRIRDFEVDSSYLWLLHQHGLQRIQLDQLLSQEATYLSRINKVHFFVNDILIENDKHQFSSNLNRVKFEIIAPSLERQQDITYAYRLVGIDKTWNLNGYNQNSIEYKSLPAGNYELELVLRYKNKEQDRRSFKFSIEKPLWQQWWFVLLIISIFFIISYWFYSIRLKQQENEAKRINELNASKLTAIQSQMNPHFIFNALNSIQEYIVLNEKKQATKYLGMFADLMRTYLRQGKLKLVTVEEEIEALKLYLELEKMRFEDSLTYTVIINTKVNENIISIPSLLIQPYVENALKHGLLHKESDRNLIISFDYNSDDQLLICEIEDNGIGRKRSKEINIIRNPNHKSFATNATKKRLELLNYSSKKAIGEKIDDLYNEDGLAIGTRVTLTIPVELGN